MGFLANTHKSPNFVQEALIKNYLISTMKESMQDYICCYNGGRHAGLIISFYQKRTWLEF